MSINVLEGDITIHDANIDIRQFSPRIVSGRCTIAVNVPDKPPLTREDVFTYLRDNRLLTLRIIEDLKLYEFMTAPEIAAVGRMDELNRQLGIGNVCS